MEAMTIMGMAASQARFLGLTARKSNVEYQGQQINQQRTSLSNESANLYNQMMELTVPTPPSTNDFYTTVYTLDNSQDGYATDDYTIANTVKTYNGENQYRVTLSHNVETRVGQQATYKTAKRNVYAKDNSYYELNFTNNNFTTSVLLSTKENGLYPYKNQTKVTSYKLDDTKLTAGVYKLSKEACANDNYTKPAGWDDLSAEQKEAFAQNGCYFYKDENDNVIKFSQDYGKVPEGWPECDELVDASFNEQGQLTNDVKGNQVYKMTAEQVENCNEPGLTPDQKTEFANGCYFYKNEDGNYVFSATYRSIPEGWGEEYSAPKKADSYYVADKTETTGRTLDVADNRFYKLESDYFEYNEATGEITENYPLPTGFKEWFEYLDDNTLKQEIINGGCYFYKDSKGGFYFLSNNDFDKLNTDDDAHAGENIYLGTSRTYKQTYTTQVDARLEQSSNGRFSSITISNNSDYPAILQGAQFNITAKREYDENAYKDAFNDYEYEKAQYEKAISDINAKTEVIQNQDQQLELRLQQLNTEQNAISTEMDSVSKVIEDNVEKTFKVFA